MEINKKLSIVIPTYNRADFLDYNLEVHIPMLKEYGIEIAIFDNCSTDNTQEVVSKWMKEYDYLTYHKNEINVGPDANFEKALKYPNTDYIWLLGDTSKIAIDTFKSVADEINNKYDLIVINNSNRVKDIQSIVYNDANKLLRQLGWHMTQMSALIFSKQLINNVSFSRYYDTNFIQTGIIFEYLASKEKINVKWLREYSANQLKKEGLVKNSWQSQTFEIWIIRWANFILSLPPSYNIENKLYTIKLHNEITKLFGIKNLVSLRSKNHFNLKIFFKYYKFFYLALNKYSFIRLFFIALIPKSIFILLISIVKNKKKLFHYKDKDD
ncbi:glycosyltransferase [Candidatus Gracilibacteria bacterium]|nr:glycosyltransferase [Candidatus Gracilibacteria bacterium]